mgnify:CR=1 FL=1
MKKIIMAINHYFLHDEDEKAHWSDYVWFYGTFGYVGIILIFLLFINLINFWG